MSVCLADPKRVSELHYNRTQAVKAEGVAEYTGSTRAANKYLRAKTTGVYAQKHPARARKRWSDRMEKTGGVQDAPRSGRPSRVPYKVIMQLVVLLFLGWTARADDNVKVWRGFTGIDDMMKRSAKARRLLAPCGPLKHASVWKRMKQLIPKLSSKKKPVDHKQTLDARTKQLRKACALELLRLSRDQLDGIIFLDAKKLWVAPGTHKVYMLEKGLAVEDARLPQGKANSGTSLHYYAAVNALMGVVLFQWVTGTSELQKGYRTLVSAR
jgi:hypothetical protein